MNNRVYLESKKNERIMTAMDSPTAVERKADLISFWNEESETPFRIRCKNEREALKMFKFIKKRLIKTNILIDLKK